MPSPGSFGTGTTSGASTGTTPDSFPTLDTSPSISVASPSQLQTLNAGMNAAQFMAMTGVTSTELATYQTGASLNQKAYELVQYLRMDPITRQSVQQDMVNANILAATKATGMASDGLAAFKDAINLAGSAKIPVAFWLANAQQNGIAGAEQTALQEANKATASLQNPAAVQIMNENPTTLSADVQQAWDQTLGYAADPSQISAFVNAIHAQDASYAEAGNAATKANDQQVLANTKAANTSLQALGIDGSTMFASLYQKALGQPATAPGVSGPTVAPGGLNINGVNAQGGTATATSPEGPTQMPPTSGAPANNVPVMSAQQAPQTGRSALPVTNLPSLAGIPQTAENVGKVIGDAAGAVGNALHSWLNPPDPSLVAAETHKVLTHSNAPKTGAPATQTTVRSTTSATPPAPPAVRSGLYQLTPALWQAALTQYGQPSANINAYPTEASAPIAVQQAAFNALSLHLFSQTNSWASVTEQLQSGSPTAKPTTTQQHYADSINSQINADVAGIQNGLNNQPVVTEKFTAPDATAEANAAAKASDPIGYTAANISSAGAVLQSMIYGNPVSELQNTSDTFTGPVAPTSPSVSATSTASVAA